MIDLRAQEEFGVEPRTLKAPKRPSQCRKYLRDALTNAYPLIVDDFVKNGRLGCCQRLKYVNEILISPVPVKREIPRSRTLSKWVKEMRENR